MKKAFVFFVALIFLFATVSFALASEDNGTTTEDNSTDLEDTPNELSDSVEDSSNETEDLEDLNETEEIENKTEDVESIVNETEDNETIVEEPTIGVDVIVVNNVCAEGNVSCMQPNETETNITEEAETEDAGVTPDNTVLWGLERAIERIDMLFTLGKSAKAQKGLAHARERLLEVQAMIAANRLAAAEKAATAYEETMSEVDDNVKEIGDGNAEGDLQDVEQLQNQIQAQAQEFARIQARIKIKAANLTQEQRAAVDALIAAVKDSAQEVKVSAAQKRNKIEVRIKAKAAEKQARTEQETEEGSGEGVENQTRLRNETAKSKPTTTNTSKGKGKE